MKTFIQPGDIITVIAPVGGITANQGLLIGGLFGIATTSALQGDDVEIAITGVFDMPKASATVIAQGDQVAWDDTVKETALPGVGLFPVGIATAAAGNGVTTVSVRLDGVATAAA
jgi:predicted RecA/RadA family phage recombinase